MIDMKEARMGPLPFTDQTYLPVVSDSEKNRGRIRMALK
jgi:hypothetical protein